MEKNRILTLYKIFVTKTNKNKQITMKEILFELQLEGIECCEKSLHNDINQLKKVLHLNIESTKGRYAKYYLESFIFNVDEAKQIIDSINAYTYISNDESEAIINKVKKLINEFQQEDLDRDFHTVTRFKVYNNNVIRNIELLNAAIRNQHQVKFNYCSWTIGKELKVNKWDKRISPFSIVLYRGNYYLFGFKMNSSSNPESRIYRLDKMVKIREVPLSRIGIENFNQLDMDIFISRRKSMYNGQVVDVLLDIPNNKIGVFIDQFGKENIIVVEKKKDRVRISFAAVASRPFLIWLLGIGKIKILKPKSAINDLDKIISEYNDTKNI